LGLVRPGGWTGPDKTKDRDEQKSGKTWLSCDLGNSTKPG